MNKFDEVRLAVCEAKDQLRAVDHQVCVMAKLIIGRLRAADVSPSVLSDLKRELRAFNIHTGKWAGE